MSKDLLAVIELGGYPNFARLYESLGFTVHTEASMRNAVRTLKKVTPAVVVAEFNFQSDFRDRTSSLETLMSVLQRLPDCKVIVFYEQEFAHQLRRFTDQHPVHATLAFPIDEAALKQALQQAGGQ
ncbi:MAG: hypothetical protein GC149_03925 [Gammaproteobacteria bacterium]|nr:hypothetical protein [Gammaproteobacteria bacterium]